ncbi:hypothetical protein D3C80_1458330 [compost metagenome]
MEAQAALVRADGAAHLHAVATVDAHHALIVDPRYAEQDGAFRLDHALEDGGLHVARFALQEGPQAAHHFFDRLVEFRLVGVAALELGQEGVKGQGHGDASKVFYE